MAATGILVNSGSHVGRNSIAGSHTLPSTVHAWMAPREYAGDVNPVRDVNSEQHFNALTNFISAIPICST